VGDIKSSPWNGFIRTAEASQASSAEVQPSGFYWLTSPRLQKIEIEALTGAKANKTILTMGIFIKSTRLGGNRSAMTCD
jgi:hypothetical protein